MGYGRAHMKEEAFRGLIDYENEIGLSCVRTVGPYSTVGAARGAVTRECGSMTRWSSTAKKITKTRVQRATGWEDVE